MVWFAQPLARTVFTAPTHHTVTVTLFARGSRQLAGDPFSRSPSVPDRFRFVAGTQDAPLRWRRQHSPFMSTAAPSVSFDVHPDPTSALITSSAATPKIEIVAPYGILASRHRARSGRSVCPRIKRLPRFNLRDQRTRERPHPRLATQTSCALSCHRPPALLRLYDTLAPSVPALFDDDRDADTMPGAAIRFGWPDRLLDRLAGAPNGDVCGTGCRRCVSDPVPSRVRHVVVLRSCCRPAQPHGAQCVTGCFNAFAPPASTFDASSTTGSRTIAQGLRHGILPVRVAHRIPSLGNPRRCRDRQRDRPKASVRAAHISQRTRASSTTPPVSGCMRTARSWR